jgi:hypothetical protein
MMMNTMEELNLRTSRMACIPLSPGIWISTIAISGRKASACSITARPVFTQTTWHSLPKLDRIILLMDSSMIPSSSATNIRNISIFLLLRDGQDNRRALIRTLAVNTENLIRTVIKP